MVLDFKPLSLHAHAGCIFVPIQHPKKPLSFVPSCISLLVAEASYMLFEVSVFAQGCASGRRCITGFSVRCCVCMLGREVITLTDAALRAQLLSLVLTAVPAPANARTRVRTTPHLLLFFSRWRSAGMLIIFSK